MAKPNPNQGRYDQKKAEPEVEQVQEQEEEAQKDANDSEQKQNHQQNTLGNAALQNQMIGTGQPNPGDQGGGGAGMSIRRADQESERDYGDDGDADDGLPLTLEDLTRSWNPGTPKSKDRPSWLEPMPSDELPPEDEDYLAQLGTDGPRRVHGAFTVDSQLQPSRRVVAASLTDWSRAVRPWAGTTLLERAIAHGILPGASYLHDANGRVLLHRVRTGAVGSLLVQRGDTLRHATDSATVGFVAFCLELHGHRRHAELVRIDPGVEGKQMPRTSVVLERCFQARPASVTQRSLPDLARERLLPVLDTLLDLEDPAVYLPSMLADVPDEDEDEDPLGLDAILAQFIGAGPERDAPLFYSAMQAAERLAAATARTRIHVAAAAVAVGQVARMYSSGPPMDDLLALAHTTDAETDKNLRLLVEVARAAQKRTVAPKGLKAGLTRAVRGLARVHESTRELLASIVGGIVPGQPTIAPPSPPPADPLTEAWMDGEPAHALDWLRSLPPSPSHRAATTLTALDAGAPAGEAARPLLEDADALDDPLLATALRVFAGPCLLAGGAYAEAAALAAAQQRVAVERRNGMLLADATLLAVEAARLEGHPEQARELHLAGGRAAWAIAAPAALSVLARYTLPDEVDA